MELEGLDRKKLKKDSTYGIWRKPTGSTIKINFDGAFRTNTFTLVFGIVARNRDGHVLASRTLLSENTPSSFVANAIACLQAIQMRIDQRWSDVIVEGDASTIIKKMYVKFY